MSVDPRLTEGIQFFNYQHFFECHEVIEKLWLETKGESRHFYKGLIQAAVAIHHFKNQNLSGARGLYKTSVEYLSAFTPSYMGVDVEKLIREMKICFKDLTVSLEESGIKIKQELIPKIELVQ